MGKLKKFLAVMRVGPGDHRRELVIKLAMYVCIAVAFAVGVQWVFWTMLMVAISDAWFLAVAAQQRREGIAILTEMVDVCDEANKCVHTLMIDNQRLKDRLASMSVQAPNNLLITDKISHDA